MASTSKHATARLRRALLAAAEASIVADGFAQLGVVDVAKRAGVSVNVVREHFADNDELLRGLSSEFVVQMRTVTDQATRSGIWKGAPARDVIEVAVRSVIDVVLERKELVRTLLAQGTNEPLLLADLREIGTYLTARLVSVLAECTNVPARPSRALAFSLLMAAGLAHHRIMVGDEWSGVAFSKEQLAEEASSMIAAYLGLQPTISFRDDSPDAAQTTSIAALIPDDAPTDAVQALTTSEMEIVE
jgi:AcrR family transcriptional regulator